MKTVLKYAACVALLMNSAWASSEDMPDGDDSPHWVRDLGELSAVQQQIYTNKFAAAKRAYSSGSQTLCLQFLTECEAIYAKNPNVWNLRASVYIAQKNFDEALIWLEKVRSVAPDDLVANLNFSLLHLGAGRYEQSIEEIDVLIDELKYKKGMDALVHSLIFRKFICLLKLGKVDEARAVVAKIDPMSFTPLYYYSQSMLNYVAGDKKAAARDMAAADRIYRTDSYLQAYKQNIQFSGLLSDKPAAEAETK